MKTNRSITEEIKRKIGKVSAAKEEVVSSQGDEMTKKKRSDLPKGFCDRAGRLYVSGKYKGKRITLNTGRAVKDSLKWIKQSHNTREQVFLNLIVEKEKIEKEKEEASTTLKAFGDAYLEKTSDNREHPTQNDYVNLFHNVILAEFSSFKMKDIKAVDIEAFLNKLKSEYHGSRCIRIKGIFNKILSSAADHGHIGRNPFDFQDVKEIVFDTRPRKKKVYTRGEIINIVHKSRGWLGLYLHLGFVYAMRPGEIIHLQWKNIDFENEILHMKGSISRGVILNGNACASDGKVIKRHVRDITMFPETMRLLKEHFLNGTENTRWVFTAPETADNWTDTKCINENHFQPFLRDIGVKYKTLKVMRNSSITQQLGEDRSFAFKHMLSGRMDKKDERLKYIQEEVGHTPGSSVTTTHYFTPEVLDHKDEMAKADKIYWKIMAGDKNGKSA